MEYVIVEVGFEYNDETYNQAEDDGGRPLLVFADQKKAEAERDRLEREKRATLDPYDLAAYCGECSGEDEDDCKHKGLRFYTVVPVERR